MLEPLDGVAGELAVLPVEAEPDGELLIEPMLPDDIEPEDIEPDDPVEEPMLPGDIPPELPVEPVVGIALELELEPDPVLPVVPDAGDEAPDPVEVPPAPPAPPLAWASSAMGVRARAPAAAMMAIRMCLSGLAFS